MSEVARLLEQIRNTDGCVVLPSRGLPLLRRHERLPDDLLEFFALCGGARLFDASLYAMQIVGPAGFARANLAIVGTELPDDITDSWYIVARDVDEVVSVDCHPERLGRCYDSFWEVHGVAGACAIVARSFTELLRRIVEAGGECLYREAGGAPDHGDAYGAA